MKPYHRVALIYLAFGAVWIFFSDRALTVLFAESKDVTWIHTTKGWVFVWLSSVLVYAITRQACQKEAAMEREKQQVFRRTVAGVYHIMFNYLNNMQLVLLEASECQEFDKDTLRLAKLSAASATNELKKLEHIEVVTPGNIDAVINASVDRV